MEFQNSNIDDAQDNWKILMTKLCSQFNTVDQHDKSDFSQDITEQQLIDSFKSQIKDNKLIILFNSKLQNIEFVNDFDIETLTIYNCENVIPKINNPRIKNIEFDNCKIKCLNDIQLPNLEVLKLEDNCYNVKNILQSLRQFKKLKELLLRCYRDIDLKLIVDIQLTKLELSRSNLTNIELLTRLTQLTNLSLENNQGIDISPLSQMIQLTNLKLNRCDLKNVDCLKPLVNLIELDLSKNENVNIHSLQFLKNLNDLNLEQCSLIDLTYLEPLINLKQLNISQTNIIYLEPLKELIQIECLDAKFNLILDVTVLNNHPNFCSYRMDDQDQPDIQEIIIANKLRDINAQVTTLRYISNLNSNLKSFIALERNNVDQCLQRAADNTSQFIGQAASLFQQLSSFQCFQ
ncbi:leucine-rich_repeat domain-containing protein [Hexamita inflata]|uniref:Leucine-rich repeat domain-containing protein n=1 Tax=Hexamita inflata TaxID=28002 RepID=A0AA86TDT3_9EUKA|nr:leucine-rich repeat domain-containing protein [Hexamita inflata]